ncbi:sarcosine oxidase subunit gamma [Streptomyces sp. Amel2xC10]|uniref:sarcosine oxidase subunit gamma n=1 Tax=Streptomyces sp. Amel2xC10 TaxID=1305826 RepID=UPI000A0896AA|nr:sarcosine oxidase subunit gamma family protein [Streptomyces sp. Amel2xC10]SME90466.1 sarcosine oxidase subunit gamma [Streptomyces sp. Amel2xC10]
MADPTRRTALAAATRASRGAVRLAELPFLTQLDLRLDPKDPAADAVNRALGLDLPLEPNSAVHTSSSSALWLGPDEWLLLGRPGTQRKTEASIREAAGDAPVSVTDVSAQRTTFLVSGPRARDLLSHGCSLDLHPRAFTPRRCAQTTLARTHITLVSRDHPSPGFWLLVRSSYAPYLTNWLLDATTEYLRPDA